MLIGISLSLSGDFSDEGKAAMRGYKLWQASVNAQGGLLGRKVQLKIVDDTSSPNQAVTNYENLISHDKVDFVLGPFSTLLTAPSATVAHRYGYAFIEPAGGGSRITLTYNVGGFADRPLADWAPIVDEVLGGQLKRLTRYITQGNPEAPKVEGAR